MLNLYDSILYSAPSFLLGWLVPSIYMAVGLDFSGPPRRAHWVLLALLLPAFGWTGYLLHLGSVRPYALVSYPGTAICLSVVIGAIALGLRLAVTPVWKRGISLFHKRTF